MLATVPREEAESVVRELRELGYHRAAAIGRTVESSEGERTNPEKLNLIPLPGSTVAPVSHATSS